MSATLNGKSCTRNGISSYWDCTGFSSALSGNSDFVVTYQVEAPPQRMQVSFAFGSLCMHVSAQNGETDSVKYSACKVPSGAQIF